jgi:UDP-GlcNAc3NAcA epimerase
MKIAGIVGARPQFIKAATISRVLASIPDIQEIIIHTGQHFDNNMSDIFFETMQIPKPDYNLEIHALNHGAMTGRMLEKIEMILIGEKPDFVLVYGDTNSTLAGALAAAKLHIPLGHVEAGLRSYNRIMPEEINRVLTDHAADLLFAPTERAVDILYHEGLSKKSVFFSGDVMYDAALYYAARTEAESTILKQLSLPRRGYTLVTIHRAENSDNPNRLRAIFNGLKIAAENLPVVLPLHPRTKKALERERLLDDARRIFRLIEPVGYLDMVKLEKNARQIATDSGGVQKEAYFFGIPCVTLRTETEWVELLELGWNRLANPDSEKDIANKILTAIKPDTGNKELYGEGNAASKIVGRIISWPNELS